MLSPQTNLSHQICNVAKEISRSIQTRKKTHEGMTKLIQTFISNFPYFTCGNFHSWNKIAQNSN